MLLKYPLILASQSPRRRQLLTDLGLKFEVRNPRVPELFPGSLHPGDVPGYLAQKKAEAIQEDADGKILLSADTVVVLNNRIQDKPEDERQAKKILSELSGKTHTVYSGYCIGYERKYYLGTDQTDVTFKELSDREIDYYIRTSCPTDKAGAYGIQDWIGMIGIEKIIGSHYNVIGLPVHKIYAEFLNLDLIRW